MNRGKFAQTLMKINVTASLQLCIYCMQNTNLGIAEIMYTILNKVNTIYPNKVFKGTLKLTYTFSPVVNFFVKQTKMTHLI